MSEVAAVRIFVSSPSDLKEERQHVKNVIADLNNLPRYRDCFKLVAYAYEDSTPALIGSEPQLLVNTYMLEPQHADIFICMLWHRMGTPLTEVNPETGLPYKSGTEYEFLNAYRSFQQSSVPRILLYRCKRPTDLDSVDLEQYGRVKAFFDRFTSNDDLQGFVGSFHNLEDLRQTIWNDLTQLLDRSLPEKLLQPTPAMPYAREQRLKAMIIDHSSFIDDRLSCFVGRSLELAEITQRIKEKQHLGGYLTITGQAGQGKSSVIAKLVESYGKENVAHHFIPFNPGPDHQVSILQNLISILILKYDLSDIYVSSDSRPTLRNYFLKVLDEISTRGCQEVIFIDGLDQIQEDSTGERDLSFLPLNLPSGIVCVLGTRPNDTLKPLELLRPHSEYRLPGFSRSDFDLMLHHQAVNLRKKLADKIYESMQANALYLNLVVKELAETQDISPDTIIQNLTENPQNIFSLTIARLKRKPDQWAKVLKPVLAILVTAQAPITKRTLRELTEVDGDSLRDGLQRLGGLIILDGNGGFQLFHLKLRDFLRGDDNKSDMNYVFDSEELQKWHIRLLNWCDTGKSGVAEIWKDDSNNASEQVRRLYAREHYITHLFEAKEWDRLWELLDNVQYGKSKILNDPSTRGFTKDLELGCAAIALSSTTGKLSSVPRLWRYSLLIASLTNRIRFYPDELFSLLVMKEREREALELVELLPTPERKACALCRIGEAVVLHSSRSREALMIFQRASEYAALIENKWVRAEIDSLFVKILSELKEWEAAINVAYQFGDSLDRIKALGIIVVAMATAGEIHQSEQLYAQFKKLSLLTGCCCDAEKALGSVMRICNNTDDLWNIVDELAQYNIHNSRQVNMTIVAKALIGLGKHDDAMVVMTKYIHDIPYKTEVLLAIARKLATINNKLAYEKLELIVQQIQLSQYTSVTADIIISASLLFSTVGETLRGIDILTKYASTPYVVNDLDERVAALIRCSEDIAELGSLDVSKQLLFEATTIARAIEDVNSRKVSLKNVADATGKFGDGNLAVKLYIESGLAPFPALADINDAILTLLNQRKWSDAIDLMNNDRYLEGLLEQERWEESVKFARGFKAEEESNEELTSLGVKSSLVRVIRTSLVIKSMKTKNIDLAQQLLIEAMDIASTIEHAQDKIKALVAISESAAELGQKELVVQLANDILAQINSFEVTKGKTEVMYQLATYLIKVQEYVLSDSIINDLISLVNDNDDDSFRIATLRLAVKAFSLAKEYDQMLAIIFQYLPKTSTRRQLLNCLPLTCGILEREPTTISSYVQSFAWVDNFLKIDL